MRASRLPKRVGFLAALALLCFSGSVGAQGVRVGNSQSAPTTTTTILSQLVLAPVPSANVQFCNAPANGAPCSNLATTYTDATLGTPCASNTQIVLDGTTTCVAATDSLGNWGVWVPSGQYAFTFTTTGGTFGPYYVTAGGSGGGGGLVSSVFGRTGAITAQSGDYLYSQLSGLPTLYNQTIQSNGTPVTQRQSLNLIPGLNASISCIDNSGAVRTDCTINTSGGLISSGLIGEYLMSEGSGTTLHDLSGNGNDATIGACGSGNPAWGAAPAYGLVFTSASGTCVKLPAALNGARTLFAYIKFDPTSTTSAYSAPIISNGGGTTVNGVGMLLTDQTNVNTTINQGYRLNIFSNTSISTPMELFNGTGTIALSMDTANAVYINGTPLLDCQNGIYPQPCSGSSSGVNSSQYQIGGAAAGSGGSVVTYWTGTMYLLLVYSSALNSGQIISDHAWANTTMLARGVSVAQGDPTTATDRYLAIGDSITCGNGIATPWTSSLTLNGATTSVMNNCNSGYLLSQMTFGGSLQSDVTYRPVAGRNFAAIFAGTNDCASGASSNAILANWLAWGRARKLAGFKTGLITTISRTALDTCKNSIDALGRANWNSAFDVLIDAGSSLYLGADGAYANARYFQDGIHPTQGADTNIIAPLASRAFNSVFGNQDFSSGNTYTTGAAAATAITATSEASATVTVTSTLNPPVGSCVIIAGVTPSGYNSDADGCWLVLTTGGASFTYLNYTTGLGAGTIFGTATVPQELDADVYATLGGSSAAQTHTLQTCVGRTGQSIYRRITDTNAWTIKPFVAAETIDGGATFTTPVAAGTNYPIVKLTSVLTSSAAAGCTWTASLQ